MNKKMVNTLKEDNAITMQPKSREMQGKLEKMKLQSGPVSWRRKTQYSGPRLRLCEKKPTHCGSSSFKRGRDIRTPVYLYLSDFIYLQQLLLLYSVLCLFLFLEGVLCLHNIRRTLHVSGHMGNSSWQAPCLCRTSLISCLLRICIQFWQNAWSINRTLLPACLVVKDGHLHDDKMANKNVP